MSNSSSWKDQLAGRISEEWGREIDVFETQISLRKLGKIEEKLFAETRLRRGVYGQRYDNGQRHDGEKAQTLCFASGEATKGPLTMWDAPGMQRIKIPMGKLSAEQLDGLADVAEEYSDGILHVTTRQDFQFHFVHIEDTPDLMRRLAAVGITTREACGNTIRNVTACPLAGICPGEAFDVTPYAHAVTFFLQGHDDTQNFGRKFKIAFSGCKETPCGLTTFHDLGVIARVRDGKRGFEIYVGGGLGAVPQTAQLFDEFLPEDELLPICQAVSRVFARHGEKANRARARVKFLVKKLGIDAFRTLVLEERATLRPDIRWTKHLGNLDCTDERPLHPPGPRSNRDPEGPFDRWTASNVIAQRQKGYAAVTVTLPLGDLTSHQARQISDLARKYTGDAIRTTVEQNLLLRWVREGDLLPLYRDLTEIGLGEPGAGSITDVTACPGTDTCKLGISSSRGLAAQLRAEFAAGAAPMPAVEALRIKTSGCFNSCGQHHVADIGYLGVSRNVNGRRVPHFQVVIGGQWTNNGGSYGLAIGAIPSKRVPGFTRQLTDLYARDRHDGETFAAFTTRIGKKTIRAMVEETQVIPTYEADSNFYSDWGDPREYTIEDMGVGECAGEVVPYVEIGLAASERELFEAQLLLDEENIEGAAQRAYSAMLQAARALTRETNSLLGTDPDEIVGEFRARLVATQTFWDQYAGGKFAQYLFRAHDEQGRGTSKEGAQQMLAEAQLFVDAAHQCYARYGAALATVAARGLT